MFLFYLLAPLSTEVRDILYVSQLLSSKPWLPNVSIVLSEPKTKEELENVAVWNKSLTKLLRISWITTEEDCIWGRRTAKPCFSAGIACKAVCFYINVEVRLTVGLQSTAQIVPLVWPLCYYNSVLEFGKFTRLCCDSKLWSVVNSDSWM